MGVVFRYTRLSSSISRPMVFGVVQHNGRFTPPVQMLLDTGSDNCIFDAALAQQLLGIDVVSVGRHTRLIGLEREIDAYVLPISIAIRDLKRTFETPEAYFCALGNLGGILGHHGFLDHVRVAFSHGRYFEFGAEDSERAPEPEAASSFR